ncbi:hypothetical protein N7519_000556 [Penicillium mononematosum]|uniref:uncharacterized protein n=1 Tax=Penicillium mononematosum TaxID=268346 RepID=UPI002548B517|nr:uncharacterized protein N7519_000556 [Penicillium mononematosum]KAJ6190535.1 hypothetical protein N7519_000556 [Penicillium mononematosum]
MASPESLTRPEVSTITLNESPESHLNVVDVGPSRWAIVSKVQERTNILSQRDCISKYLIAGTEFKNASLRATQAVKTYEPTELTTLKSLQEKGCDVIPRLLQYQCDQQDEDDTVPGGFITYVIWERVPGESLDMQTFWGYSFSEREVIRLKFREVYKKIKACGYCLSPGINKVIYHRPTQMIPFRTEDTQWSDRIYCSYGLVRPPTSMDQFFPITSADLKYDDKGWRW